MLLVLVVPLVDRPARQGHGRRNQNRRRRLRGCPEHHAQRSRQILEEGDIEEALNAASSIGDDRLQRQAKGYVVPEAFTHGSSAQRVRWFKQGIQTGDPKQCNTFGVANP